MSALFLSLMWPCSLSIIIGIQDISCHDLHILISLRGASHDVTLRPDSFHLIGLRTWRGQSEIAEQLSLLFISSSFAHSDYLLMCHQF